MAASLQDVDLEELSRTAARIRSMVMHGHVDEHGGLQGAFPLTLRLLEQGGHRAAVVCEDFIASPQFSQFREIPFNGKGVTAEEAFHAFLQQGSAAGDPVLGFAADHELLSFLMRTIVTGGGWTFDIRTSLVKRNAVASYAVLIHDPDVSRQLFEPVTAGPYLYAAGTRGLVHGRCPQWLEAALAGTGTVAAPQQIKLAALGLVAPNADDSEELPR